MSGFTCKVCFIEDDCTRLGVFDIEIQYFFEAECYTPKTPDKHRKK